MPRVRRRPTVVLGASAAALLTGCGSLPGSVPSPLPCAATPAYVAPDLPGPEEFAVVPAGAERVALWVSTAERAAGARGALQRLDVLPARGAVEDPGAGARRRVARDPPYVPLGSSSVAAGDGRPRLYVTNTGRRPAIIDRFDVDAGGGLTHAGAIALPASVREPNNLVAIPDPASGADHLYVSNPRPLAGQLLPLGEWPSLVHFDGRAWSRVAAVDRPFANGLASSHGGRRVYLAAYRSRELHVFERAAGTGALALACRVPLPDAPDNLTLAPGGDALYVAAQRSVLRSLLHVLTRGRAGAPSRVYRLDVNRLDLAAGGDCRAGGRGALRVVWDDGGAHVAAASTAVRIGDVLVVSQIVDPRVFFFRCR